MRFAPIAHMRNVMRGVVLVLMVIALVGCIYSRNGKPGTNIGQGSGDQGGPWTQGESGGSPALTERDR